MSEGKTEIYLNHLPRWENGRNKGKINWRSSVGYKIKGFYKGREFEVEIIDYEKSRKSWLTIKYRNKEFEIQIGNFAKCRLGVILGKKSREFKIEIGTILKDNKRDIIIINKKYEVIDRKGGTKENKKYYRYICNKCGFDGGRHWSINNNKYEDELWVREGHLLTSKTGCACCSDSPQVVVEGINDIPTTAPWMVKYFQDGYDEAKKYTKTSSKNILLKCPDCGFIKKMNIRDLCCKGFGCSRCSDGLTYPNKLMGKLLEQLGISFISEYSPDWIKPRRYDFYISSMNLIIEMDGAFHKNDNNMNGQTAEESKVIDDHKDKLANEHGIEVIRIDCDYRRYNRFEYIKNNVINSELREKLPLNLIDWIKIGQDCEKNKVKEICELKKNNPELTTTKIGKMVGLGSMTIYRYLKQGTKLGWCNYDPKEEKRKASVQNGISTRKPIKVFKEGICFGEYLSCMELERCSEKDFGVKFIHNSVSAVCNGKYKQYKGFTFKYIEGNESNGLHKQELVQAS